MPPNIRLPLMNEEHHIHPTLVIGDGKKLDEEVDTDGRGGRKKKAVIKLWVKESLSWQRLRMK